MICAHSIVRKMSKYRKETQHLAAIFSALSNPNRLELFLRLTSVCVPGAACRATAPGGFRACVGELGKGMGIAPSTLSHHIKELRTAKLIMVRRRGKNIECSIVPGILGEIAQIFQNPSAIFGNDKIQSRRRENEKAQCR